MSKRKEKTPDVVPGYVPIRDELMVVLINGATKASVFKDKKKEGARKACRGKVGEED